MKKHPNKHIQAAIEYALSKGWVWVSPGDSAHCFCKLRCGDPEGEHRHHYMSVWSTPKSAENHARQIRRKIDHCSLFFPVKGGKNDLLSKILNTKQRGTMALYNFTLTLSGVTYGTERLEDALYENGCDDALICAYGNSVYVEFDREANSLDEAIASAVENIESAGIGAVVESIDSALVGLSDIAELTKMSRQAITMLKDGTRGNGDFPCPVQRIKGQSPLWDWASVAQWLSKNGRLKEDSELVVNACILSKWNLALRTCASKDYNEVESIAASLTERRRNIKVCTLKALLQ